MRNSFNKIEAKDKITDFSSMLQKVLQNTDTKCDKIEIIGFLSVAFALHEQGKIIHREELQNSLNMTNEDISRMITYLDQIGVIHPIG